ncbi:hypothetical protein EYZ11_008934 [Aspergillus tanneri]|nr:hypothetical protein EYZ11_008934 [Aspergillus tanneri]
MANHPEILDNDVPMRGQGFYNAHSALQTAAMHRALPLFDNVFRATGSEVFTIVEYGCAQGVNSIPPIQHILQSRYSHANLDIDGRNENSEAHLIFTDRVGNDFTTLAQTGHNVQWIPETKNTGLTIFTSMAAKSFYERVVPNRSVDVGFSLATLHHLERSPLASAGGNGRETSDERGYLRQQAHHDLHRFLTLRARELKSRASLVLSFVGKSSRGIPNYPGLVNACRQAMIQMVRDGQISPSVASAFHVPTYDRTMDDVRQSLAEVQNLWEVQDLFESEIVHPAYEALQRAGFSHKSGEASEMYADTVVDWVMAVISGYFDKALQVAAGMTDLSAREGCLKEWRGRTKAIFLQQYRDEKVSCWFIFVRLIRI